MDCGHGPRPPELKCVIRCATSRNRGSSLFIRLYTSRLSTYRPDDSKVWFEKTTTAYRAVLRDDGNPPALLGSGSLTSLTIKLYSKETGDVINSKDNVNALNANGVSIDSSGNFVYTPAIADTTIQGNEATKSRVFHIAHFIWTWAGGAKRGDFLLQMEIPNSEAVS